MTLLYPIQYSRNWKTVALTIRAYALCILICFVCPAQADVPLLSNIPSVRILKGDAIHAYRDPAAYYWKGTFYVYFSYATVQGNQAYWQTAWSKSTDLVHWTNPVAFTPLDFRKNFSSPGCVVRDGNDFVLCLQTYPTDGSKKAFGDETASIFIMRSKDLENWGPAEQLFVNGYVPTSTRPMTRTIDAFLIHDKDDLSKWWCFYKQKGQIAKSYSTDDLKSWTPTGSTGVSGENPCVIVDKNQYVLMSSITKGTGGMQLSRSNDMKAWTSDSAPICLDQANWPWAKGRLTAGFILDLRTDPSVGKALLFFHGETGNGKGFVDDATLGLAWSDDLGTWSYPSGD